MSVKKMPTRSCAPRGGMVWCVEDRHADGRTAHRHFARKDEAENYVIALRAEWIGGPVVGGTTSKTFEEYAESWRQAQTWKDPDGARYSLKRAYPVIGPSSSARSTD
jgi:hypothetical protein